jgi:hypothetical protein
MITIPKEKDILLKVALNTINLTMFSRCWVQILRNVSPLFMNQIIFLSNLLSWRLLQKRAMCIKMDINASGFYMDNPPFWWDGNVCLLYGEYHTHLTRQKNNLLQLLMGTIMNMLGLVVGGQF